MSVSSMARLAEGDSAEPDSTLQSAIRLVAAYLPSEALAVYIAILGLLNLRPEASTEDVIIVRFVCYLIGLLVAVGLPFVTFKGGNLTRREQRRRQVIVAVLAALSFSALAAAMPSFFFSTSIATIRLSQWAAVIAIILVVSMPTIARVVRVRK